MDKSDAVWAGLIAAGTAYETYTLHAKQQNATLSETTRRTFHTRTRVGRYVFTAAWVGFSAWWIRHILE
jgi:hypothetical protein